MAYAKQTWIDYDPVNSPPSAARFNHMEDGIDDADTRITAIEPELPRLDEVEADVADEKGWWRTALHATAHLGPSTLSAADYLLVQGGGTPLIEAADAVSNTMAPVMIDLQNADYPTDGTREAKLKCVLTTNATAAGITLTPKLFPLTSSGGAANNTNLVLGVGVIPVAFASPAVNSVLAQESSVITMPTGVHVLGLTASAALPANARLTLAVALMLRST